YINLRTQLHSALTRAVSGIASGDPATLAEIGITFDSSVRGSISNSATLQNAINTDADAVEYLFNSADGFASRVLTLLTPFVETGGTIDNQVRSVASQVGFVDTQIKRLELVMQRREIQLRYQFTSLQETLNRVVAQQSSLNSFMNTLGLSG
ncbi:MAG: flagellar filament capping protein FliD, partial [Chloroflexota bacterium]